MSREKILILGGTQFIGRNLVKKLIAEPKYDLSIFNRGITNSGLFPEISRIHGDRSTSDMEQIKNENFDFVIDLSCYYPIQLENTLHSLSKSVKKYVFVSTCSVYDNSNNTSILRDENADILECTAEQRQSEDLSTYGNRKAECERILMNSGLNYSILRPALVYGPYDHTDRLYYWLNQTRTNSKLLLPDGGNRIFSTTYVLDLVEAITKCLGLGHSETYNIISSPQTSILKIVEACEELMNKKVLKTNAPASFLHDNEVKQWLDIPLWLDADHYTYNNQRMKGDLKAHVSSLSQGLEQTIQYYESQNWPKGTFGIDENRRSELMKQLASQKN